MNTPNNPSESDQTPPSPQRPTRDKFPEASGAENNDSAAPELTTDGNLLSEATTETPPAATPNVDNTQADASLSTEPGADLPGSEITAADRLLDGVFGDHPHQNSGCHLNGGINDDAVWQRRWKRVAQLPTSLYAAPKGKVGRRFVSTLAAEFRGVRDRQWNSERPLIFAAVILQKTTGVQSASSIRQRLTQRMDLWQQGDFAALIDDVEAEILGKVGSPRIPNDDALARSYNAKVLSGRLRSAVRFITQRDTGGVLQPDDACTKTGRPVLDVLREKHPTLRSPDIDSDDREAFEKYDNTPRSIPLTITSEVVEKVASRLSGAAGPCGVDAVDLRNWLLRFGPESAQLRKEMALQTEWLSNTHPPWAAYRAMMACRLVALDKQPGVRPLGIGEIFRRLLAKCVLSVIGTQATVACGNFNLCAGLSAGIEGAVHALQEVAAPTFATTSDDDQEHQPPAPPTPPDPDGDYAAEFQTQPPAPTSPIATVLVDARNGFNELNRRSMLWTVRHKWANGARFAFNCYRHSAQLILRR